MSNKAPTGAVYKELKKQRTSDEDKAANKKAYSKKRQEAIKSIAWWIPK